MSFTYDGTSGIHLMAVLYAAAESGVLIKRKKRKFSSVTYVGRPKIVVRVKEKVKCYQKVSLLGFTVTDILLLCK